ncbi:hypothetical protein OCU04_007953 [Sclerotinia nivalis]|uniref:Ubiquitin-like protease family profile domain-containing protein n=1 Tax=Sclerotinia nivalis TaxID=352851 RepID=A0A9X0AJV1_9HELO|nr:hypothetical protein OCU04_007953 [Sclerotinia nivalis]
MIDSQILYWDPDKGKTVQRKDHEGNITKIFVEQDLALAWKKTEEALAQYDDETLFNLDYLLIPYEYKTTHTVLLGIAPKQKFCFHIDNSGTMNPRYLDEDSPKKTVYHKTFHLNLLEAIVYSRFHKGQFDTVELPLYGQWQYRTDHRFESSRTTDNSPNAPRQEDGHNCGMLCMTNAMNLVFGYDMMCYSCRDGDISDLPPRTGKRPRVAAEFLNGGFNKPFDYPLFKIPTELREIAIDPSYKHNLRPSPPAFRTPPGKDEGEESDEKEVEEKADEEEEEEDEDEEEEEEDEDEGQSGQAGARTKVKKANRGKKVKWSGQNALDPDPSQPEPSGPGSTADGKPVRTLWPAQMDPTRTGKCGFIYAINNPRFSHPRYNNRTECKRAAVANQMKNWRMWDKMPLYMFKAWMENVMAGREDDELTPWVDVLKLDGPAFAQKSDQTRTSTSK